MSHGDDFPDPLAALLREREPEAKRVTYWHGGGRIAGGTVLPPERSGVSRSGDHGVFVTTDRTLAEAYASTVDGTAWLYEVEPVGTLEAVPSLVGGLGTSYRCAEARIVRRFGVDKETRRRYRSIILPMMGAEP